MIKERRSEALKKQLLLCVLILALLLSLCACAAGPEEKTPPFRIAVVSDIHYTGGDYRYTGSFRAANDASGTGKQVELLPSLLDAFLAQMLREKPDLLLLTGDNSFNGARSSHEALLQKLGPLREAGIVVLTLPGNHDIASPALIFPDGETVRGEPTAAEDFASLYASCGYGEALSRDPNSLSYVYDTGRGLRVFMLDTCFRYGAVYGRVKAETMSWLSRELKACRESRAIPLVAGHHNALVHHPLFAFGYTIDNGGELRELLMEQGVTFYLSGHLHPQSIVWEEGFCCIATESFAVYPHRFGLLELDAERWRYTAQATEVERWADENAVADERLVHYSEWGRRFFTEAARAQAEGNLAGVIEDETQRRSLSTFFAEANLGYFMGTPCAPPEGELGEAISALDGRTGFYLQTITALPESLYAEGEIG